MFINLNKRLKLKKFVVIDETFDNLLFINDNSLFINNNFNREISSSKFFLINLKSRTSTLISNLTINLFITRKKNVVVCVYRRFAKLKFFA